MNLLIEGFRFTVKSSRDSWYYGPRGSRSSPIPKIWRIWHRSFSRISLSWIIYRHGGQRGSRACSPAAGREWTGCTFVKHYSRGCTARTLAAQAPIVPAGYADWIVLCSLGDFSSTPWLSLRGVATCASTVCKGTLHSRRECAHRGWENWLPARRHRETRDAYLQGTGWGW